MSLGDIPVFSVLRGTMGVLTARQKVLAENIANSDTPGFTPKDIDQKSFQSFLSRARSGKASNSSPSVTLRVTDPRHISNDGASTSRAGSNVRMIDAPDSEATINGNSVVLEEQVAELADTRMRYEMAIGLYQKSVSLLRLAIKTPGR